jgi:imidazolonepropionase-like amidohydrolase
VIALAAAAGPSAQTSAQPAAQLVLQSDPRAPGHAILFRGVRVFDGQRVIPATDVLVESGSIARVAAGQKPPAGAEVIDGAGKTLLPGFIDAHTHVFRGSLGEAIVFGVTTELDMFMDVTYLRDVKAREARGSVTGAADLRSAGTLVTAPGGHGTEYGLKIPTLSAPESAQAFVDARIAEGSDYIKIVYDDGKTYAMNLPTLDAATLKATIDAAHRRGRLAVVHIGSQQGAREAIDAGADGLAHLFVDSAPAADFAADARRHGAFVIPTLSVNESVTGVASGARLPDDPRLAPYLAPATVSNLRRSFTKRDALRSGLSYAEATVHQLDSLGVPILAGTDAPNPGTAHGVSLHRELELLVASGLTPAEALTAATATPAHIFKLEDRGRIAAGLRADLVLVNGDPTRDILATRDIVGVWKRGIAVDRAATRASVAAAREEARHAAERMAAVLAAGVTATSTAARSPRRSAAAGRCRRIRSPADTRRPPSTWREGAPREVRRHCRFAARSRRDSRTHGRGRCSRPGRSP